MTDFLVKHFVKNHEQVEEDEVRTEYGTLASGVGIFCNLLLFAAKLMIGILVNSISVMADAFNNLSDAASSIIGFIGVKMAEKPVMTTIPLDMGGLSIFPPSSWPSWSYRWVFHCSSHRWARSSIPRI